MPLSKLPKLPGTVSEYHPSSSPTSVIFDLDGTLIDSSASILASYAAAFDQLGRAPVAPLTSRLIGPPLGVTLHWLSGGGDSALVDRLSQAFMQHYDGMAYLETTVFDGVEDLLRDAHAKGLPLFIATNKRIAPTRLILTHLGWAGLFQGVYALDAFEPRLSSKALVIDRIVQSHHLNSDRSLYVGDREEDRAAALESGIPFWYARWGYGDQSPPLEGEVPAAGLPGIGALRSAMGL